MNDFDALEARLKPNRNGVLQKIGDRMLSLEKLRIWFIATGAVGTLLAATSKAVTGTAGTVMVFVGAALAAVGALFVGRFDFRKLELTAFVTEAESIAESAIAAGRALEEQENINAQLDLRRLALIDATDMMREGLEQTLLQPEANEADAIQTVLDLARLLLCKSIGFEAGEAWAISVFRVRSDGGAPRLTRIGALRADTLDPRQTAREWRVNEGFVGAAWASSRDIIIDDSDDPRVAQDYPVPTALRRDYDATRYRSMAAIPIRFGPGQKVWGVVAGSSDQTGRFHRDTGNRNKQAVDTIRLIARMVALAGAAFRRNHS